MQNEKWVRDSVGEDGGKMARGVHTSNLLALATRDTLVTIKGYCQGVSRKCIKRVCWSYL